jgi:hypothetical protein
VQHESSSNERIPRLTFIVKNQYLEKRIHRSFDSQQKSPRQSFTTADHISFALCCKEFVKVVKVTLTDTSSIPNSKKQRLGPNHRKDLKQESRHSHPLRPFMLWKNKLPTNCIWKRKDGVEITKLNIMGWLWVIKDEMGGGRCCPFSRISERYDATLGDVTFRPSARHFSMNAVLHRMFG